MKIGILGCGATGSVFASYLRMGGADDIWLIDLNKAHMDACLLYTSDAADD